MRKWVLGAVMQLQERADQKVWEEPGHSLENGVSQYQQYKQLLLNNINNINGRLQTQVDLSHFY